MAFKNIIKTPNQNIFPITANIKLVRYAICSIKLVLANINNILRYFFTLNLLRLCIFLPHYYKQLYLLSVKAVYKLIRSLFHILSVKLVFFPKIFELGNK